MKVKKEVVEEKKCQENLTREKETDKTNTRKKCIIIRIIQM